MGSTDTTAPFVFRLATHKATPERLAGLDAQWAKLQADG
jgi:hypothetical protein